MRLNSTALIKSVVGVMWLIVGMTLLTEVSAVFKSFLTNLVGHHWVGKSVIAVAALIVLYVFFRKSKEHSNVLRGVSFVTFNVAAGGSLIFLFFVWHFLNG